MINENYSFMQFHKGENKFKVMSLTRCRSVSTFQRLRNVYSHSGATNKARIDVAPTSAI